MVVRARWTVDIGLDSSVVEHLNSDAGVPCSNPCPTIYVHSSHSIYKYAFDLEKLFKVAELLSIHGLSLAKFEFNLALRKGI